MLCGDYNVIPEPIDAADPAAWTGDALFQPESRGGVPAPHRLGLTDAVRACSDGAGRSTRSGTTRPAPGSGTTASASTTSCSRRRRRTG